MLRQLVQSQIKYVAKSQLRCMSSASAKDLVLVEVNDKTGYATVTLNRPPVNSLNLELLSALSQTLDQLTQNKARGLILTSVSKVHFTISSANR